MARGVATPMGGDSTPIGKHPWRFDNSPLENCRNARESATPERVTFERKPFERTILSECHFSETSFERLTNTANVFLAIINHSDTNLSDCLVIIQRQVDR